MIGSGLPRIPIAFKVPAMLLAALAIVDSAMGQDQPVIWSWLPPQGGAAHHSAFRELLQMYPAADESGASVARRLAATVRSRGLPGDRIGMVINHFGRRTPVMAYDPGDAIMVPPILATGTPWLAHGLPKARAWTDDFIAEYRRIQSEEGLPSPSRFHMDCELRLPKICYQAADGSGLAECWGLQPVELFDAMVSDPRWSNEAVPVAQPGGVSWKTLQQLHQEAGSPAWDPSQPRNALANRAWSRWYDAMQRSVMDGALEQALYAPVRAAWPSARSSEFAQSVRVDGVAEPGGRRVFRDFEWWLNGWMESAWCGVGDLQAPTMYAFGNSFMEPGVDWADANIRLDRSNLDACLHSFGGAPPETITPWVMLPGTALPIDIATFRQADAAMLEERMALMHWRGIEEFMLWPGTTPETWTRAARAVKAIWSSAIVTADLVRGSASAAPAVSSVSRADRRCLEVTAGADGIELRIRVRGSASPASACSRDRMLIHLEGGGAEGDLSVEVARMADPEQGWERIGDAPVVADGSVGLHRWWADPARHLVGPDGSVLLRVVVNGGSYRFDLFQAVRLPDPGADLDASGAVDMGDVALAMLDFGPSDGGSADLDGLGAVDFGDLALILLEFGGCDG